jgi:hypothetical protein
MSTGRRFKPSTSIPDIIGGPSTPSMSTKFTESGKSLEAVKTTANLMSKWVPLICAGTAVGIGIIALKEIKNVRKEVITMKKETFTGSSGSKELTEKIERMDEQLRKITEYLSNQNKPKSSSKSSKDKVINGAIKSKKINIINNEDSVKVRPSPPPPPPPFTKEEDLDDEDEEEIEIEVEVTDDEDDN